jgi:hypothetical protein
MTNARMMNGSLINETQAMTPENPHETQINFLRKCIENDIAKYDRKSRKYRRWTYRYKISIMLLAGTSTILLGLNLEDRLKGYLEWSRNIALVIGALITFLSSLKNFASVEKYWVRNKLVLAKLEELNLEFQYLQTSRISAEQLSQLFDKYQSIIKNKALYWENLSERMVQDEEMKAK